MTIKQEAAVFGTVVAVIVVGLLGWWLSTIKNEWPIWQFLLLCVTGTVAIALIAWRVDKRDAVRKAREKSGPS